MDFGRSCRLLGHLTSYTYDLAGRQQTVSDGENNTTTTLYYPNGTPQVTIDAQNGCVGPARLDNLSGRALNTPKGVE